MAESIWKDRAPMTQRRGGRTLGAVVGAGIGTVAAITAAELIQPGSTEDAATKAFDNRPSVSAEPSTVKEDYGKPFQFYTGEIMIRISPELNVRKQPVIREMYGEAPNKIKWSDIESVNGVNIKGAEGISVKNALLVNGGDADGDGKGESWLKIKIRTGSGEEKDAYISRSNSTAGFVQPSIMGRFERVYEQEGKILEPSGGFNQTRVISPSAR